METKDPEFERINNSFSLNNITKDNITENKENENKENENKENLGGKSFNKEYNFEKNNYKFSESDSIKDNSQNSIKGANENLYQKEFIDKIYNRYGLKDVDISKSDDILNAIESYYYPNNELKSLIELSKDGFNVHDIMQELYFDVDSVPDEDLYASYIAEEYGLDLDNEEDLEKIANIYNKEVESGTFELAIKKLRNNAKENLVNTRNEFFSNINSIRENKIREDNLRIQQEQAKYKDDIFDSLNKSNSIMGIRIGANEKQELFDFVTGINPKTGQFYINEALDDPNNVLALGFMVKYGKYWQSQLAEQAKRGIFDKLSPTPEFNSKTIDRDGEFSRINSSF